MRSFAAIIAGIIAGFVGLVIVSLIGGAIFPTKIAVDLGNAAEIKAGYAALPVQLKLVTLACWFAAALVGGIVAKRVSGHVWPIWIVFALFALLAAMNIAVLPMPAWMQASILIAPLLGAAIAHRYGPGRPVSEDDNEEEEGEFVETLNDE